MTKKSISPLSLSSLAFSKAFFFAAGFINLLIGSIFVLNISLNSGVIILWLFINFLIVMICLYEVFFLAAKFLEFRLAVGQLDQQLQNALATNNKVILENFQEIQKLQNEAAAAISQPQITFEPIFQKAERNIDD